MRKKITIVVSLTALVFLLSCGKEAVKKEEVVEEQQVEQQEKKAAKEETKQEELVQKDSQVDEVLDAIEEDYMIKPNDWLSKIAQKEYGEISMWKKIYSWNEEKIGNNPNLIYPFHELLLKNVPKERAKPLEYDYYNYEVKNNESLWSIAGNEYDNSYAWIVILRDNADVLGSDIDNIEPGTVIKLRTKILN
ncbi:MAG: LysM peptidoglycan-binding domain-containing protein [Candidatus Marinimicrobia bacterium]|nr:LysM peptidoglycan-binding domain-containing protein [Candidatus Neomarinimicrobiota bacterium]